MALNSLFCADVPLSNYSLTHPPQTRSPSAGNTVYIWYSRNRRRCCNF